jgi:large subunit ribosomal protein L13
MAANLNKTWMPTDGLDEQNAKRPWWVVDASGKTLGRLASEVAKVIRGKHNPQYTPHNDCGDFVVVINSDKITVTGNKVEDKMYYTRSRFFGSLKSFTLKDYMNKDSTHVFQLAVRGMLPKTKLGDRMITKLKIYKDDKHPHNSQKVKALSL